MKRPIGLISLAAILIALCVAARCNDIAGGEKGCLYFNTYDVSSHSIRLCRMDNAGKLEVLNEDCEHYGMVYNGRYYFYDLSEAHKAIASTLTDGSDYKEICANQSRIEKDGRWEWGFCPTAYDMPISDGKLYYTTIEYQGNDSSDLHICCASLDGSGGQVYDQASAKFLSPLLLYKRKLYYRSGNGDKVTFMCLDPETGNAAEAFSLREEYFTKRLVTMEYIYLDDGVIWFTYITHQENRASDEHLCEYDIKGNTLKYRDDLKVDYQFYVHNGWLYYFQGEEHTVSDLVRTNARTGQTQKMHQQFWCCNYFPQMDFGQKGFVIEEDLTGSAEQTVRYWYVPYDGSGAVMLPL